MTTAEQDWHLWHLLDDVNKELWDRNEREFMWFWDQENEQNCYKKVKTDKEIAKEASRELPF